MESQKMARPANLPPEMVELDKLAAPLVEWVRKNYGYNASVHISADFVQVTIDDMSIPYPISEP